MGVDGLAEGTLSVASIASMGEEVAEEGGAGVVDKDDESYSSTDANGGDGDSEGERDDLDDGVAGGEGTGEMA